MHHTMILINLIFFFFNDTATTEIYTLSLHDALPISMMLSDVPNYAFAIGYTNASWTLKADLTSEYVCRLLKHMEANGRRIAIPHRDPAVAEEPLLDFSSGYVQRSLQIGRAHV